MTWEGLHPTHPAHPLMILTSTLERLHKKLERQQADVITTLEDISRVQAEAMKIVLQEVQKLAGAVDALEGDPGANMAALAQGFAELAEAEGDALAEDLGHKPTGLN